MKRRLAVMLFAAAVFMLSATPAWAHDAPEGSEWVMADWMFLSFVAFAGSALLVFVVARRRGLLSNLEDAKYHLLTIDEPDYYTPEWAIDDEREGEDALR